MLTNEKRRAVHDLIAGTVVVRDSSSTQWSDVDAVLTAVAKLPEFSGGSHLSVNSVGTLGNTPLHVVASRGDVRAIELLVAAGASLYARGARGNSALHEAAEQGHLEGAIRLVELGASEAAVNDQGRTPLEVAQAAGHSRVAHYLAGR